MILKIKYALKLLHVCWYHVPGHHHQSILFYLFSGLYVLILSSPFNSLKAFEHTDEARTTTFIRVVEVKYRSLRKRERVKKEELIK